MINEKHLVTFGQWKIQLLKKNEFWATDMVTHEGDPGTREAKAGGSG